MVASHGTLMHRATEWFVRQPPSAASVRSAVSDLTASGRRRTCPDAASVRDHRSVMTSVRRATASDAEALADLYLRALNAASAYIPTVHTDDEVRWFIVERVVPRMETWLAVDSEDQPIGMLVLDAAFVDQLYVEPTLTGRGIGTELLELAKRERPAGLRLWTFEANFGARRFYERHDFSARDRTDGDNEQGVPDVLYVWDGDDR
jgi:GNAT superfamily N-acetyltransferase